MDRLHMGFRPMLVSSAPLALGFPWMGGRGCR